MLKILRIRFALLWDVSITGTPANFAGSQVVEVNSISYPKFECAALLLRSEVVAGLA